MLPVKDFAEGLVPIAGAVVGEYTLDGDTEARVEGDRPTPILSVGRIHYLKLGRIPSLDIPYKIPPLVFRQSLRPARSSRFSDYALQRLSMQVQLCHQQLQAAILILRFNRCASLKSLPPNFCFQP